MTKKKKKKEYQQVIIRAHGAKGLKAGLPGGAVLQDGA